MLIQEILEKKGDSVLAVSRDIAVGDIVKLLAEKRIGTVLVTDQDNGLAGIVSERDVIKHLARRGADALGLAVEEIMTKQVYSCAADSGVGAVLEQMSARSIRHVPVVRNGIPIGLVSTRDLLFAQRKILIEDNKRRQQVADTILMSQLD